MGTGEGRWTLVLVNLASIMEKADEALLPSVYKEVGAALHVTPTGLGSLSLLRSIVQVSCYPLAIFMANRFDRTRVVALGAFLWAAATFLVAVSTTFLQALVGSINSGDRTWVGIVYASLILVKVAISRALNGIGLALVVPAIQSLVADSTDESTRGSAFGWLQLTGKLGSILGGFFSILLASTLFMGIAGWRIAFHLVAIVSVIVGILVQNFAVDPNYTKNVASGGDPASGGEPISHKSVWSEVEDLIKEARAVIKIPSFQIIVAQGVAGTFPGSALKFAPMWLELIGFSHKGTAFLVITFEVATAIGGLFGGKMGDFLAKHFPDSGRIVLSQISSGSYVPLAAVLLLVLPDDPSSGLVHGLVFFIMGLSTSWNAPATNNPIFAEIVPRKARTSIYALDRSFESVLASFAPPVVGLLAEHIYGYKPVPSGSSNGTNVKTDRENAASLAKALYTAIAIPISLCCFIYSFLYCTYPRDRERARMNSLIASEIEQIELENSRVVGDYTQIHLTERMENEKDQSVINAVYKDKDFEINNNDEETLLSH